MMLLLALAAGGVSAPACDDLQTQTAMTQCAGRQYQVADAAMTRQWKVTYAYMKGRDAQDTTRGGGFGYAAALLASQRAWLTYRDKQCVIVAGEYAGGSLQPMVAAQCRRTLTDARAGELKALVSRQ